ncbi:hypothetical protein U9M48_005771 [Paspalum notatum var. saurae]|uniref:phosphatidylserine decarboxylase n=1 Tax=Paspalum notatum var. saurae TaxID=547442 RepID=A0AAQ3SFN8_PASNO
MAAEDATSSHPSRYVKLTKDQDAPTEDIRPGELNQPVHVPQLEGRRCSECGQVLPESYEPPADEPWTTGIFGCTDDPDTCRTGLFCPCVLFGRNVEALREDIPWTTPCVCHAVFIEGGITLAILTAIFHGFDPRASFLIGEGLVFSWWLCATYTGIFRQELQRKYHLKNSPCDPCMVHCCLHWCANCQEHRERRGRLAENNAVPMTVVNPPPVQEMRMPESRGPGAAAPENGAGNAPEHEAAKSRQEGKFLLPGATAAALVMLALLHARRMYDDTKDVPVFMRSAIYKAWARAFHSDLQEVALPLDEYPSLQAFFIRGLKEGARPIDPDPNCLVSPVDGKVLRLGELRGPGTMIEQVKGFSYSVSSLLGTNSSLHYATEEELPREQKEKNMPGNLNARSWLRLSVASPKLRDQTLLRAKKGIFYCVIYLHPGDYHRVHSPVDWNVLRRRHFSGHLFPQNERAVRTIKNLYVENERVVLEGRWREGFVAMAAIGATNVGSIRVNIEPELRTNREVSRIVESLPPEERVYEPEGTGVEVKKGEEIAGFKMGSTVVVVFEAPVSKWKEEAREEDSGGISSADFDFCVKAGDRVRVGEAIGRWGGDGERAHK